MIISLVNHSHETDEAVQTVIRAINRQINEDFQPHWKLGATLRLEGHSSTSPKPSELKDMRGEAVLYLLEGSDTESALGYHNRNHKGIAYGFVFLSLCRTLGVAWSSVLSHEALELVGDRQANLLVRGPHPKYADRYVMHWREMCDAVQADLYHIDGVEVSNFVLPLYFTEAQELGGRNDFLGRVDKAGNRLTSFGVNPGGYIGFYDPKLGRHDQVFADRMAESTNETKSAAGMARRGERYQDKIAEMNNGLEELQTLTKTDDITIRSSYPDVDVEILATPQAKKSQVRGRKQQTELSSALIGAGLIETGIAIRVSPAKLKNRATANLLLRNERGPIFADLKLQPGYTMLAMLVDLDADDNEAAIQWLLPKNVQAIVASNKANKGVRAARLQDIGAEFQLPVLFESQANSSRASGIKRSFKLGRRIFKFFKVKIVDKLEELVIKGLSGFSKDLAVLIEGKLKTEQMRYFKPNLPPIQQPLKDIKPKSGDYLLFVHGIFSTAEEAFGDLLHKMPEQSSNEVFDALTKQYQNRMIAYDHWTVAKSALKNAEDLIKSLPKGLNFDIICHSRGAGVVRAMLEHPDLKDKFKKKQFKVKKVLFVAGANQGSPLALPGRVDDLVNVLNQLALLAKLPLLPVAVVTRLLSIAAQVTQNLPGVESMSPDSDFVKKLNQKHFTPVERYIYFRANFDPQGLLTRFADEGLIDRLIFKNEPNDVVVPYKGAAEFDESTNEFTELGLEFGGQDSNHPGAQISTQQTVWHINFFSQPSVRSKLIEILC